MQKYRVFASTLEFLRVLKFYKLATLLINGLNFYICKHRTIVIKLLNV